MIEKITERVLVIGEHGSANVTLIEGKNCLIIVDTSLFPEKSAKVAKFARELFGKPVKFVINTHYHPDHTFGNYTFMDSIIISSNKTKEILERLDLNYIKSVWKDKEYGKYHIVIPNTTFEDEFHETLCGKKIFIKKLGGHTPDSSMVYIEEDEIVITGDLVFNEYHPEIASDSNIKEWLNALDTILEIYPIHIIPGHGPASNIKTVVNMKEYLTKLQLFLNGKIDEFSILKDKNFTSRKFPQLFESSIKVLSKIT